MTTTVTRQLVSIICPVFNEEACIRPFFDRLDAVLQGLRERYDFELIFTNNGSHDRTREEVLALRREHPWVQLLTLTRNFGYQASVLSGLRQASGQLLVIIDVDCEDPPEMIPRMLEQQQHGYDLVYGERGKRHEPAVITLMRKVFYRLNRLLADSDIIVDMAEFCLMTADLRDAIVANRSTFPFLRGEIAAQGFARIGIPYDRGPRIMGTTHYRLWGMVVFAVAGILSSTTFPLRFTLYVLPALYLFNALALYGHLQMGLAWAFPVVVLTDLLYLATALSSVSLYLARTYRNVVGRPLVVVDWNRSATNVPRERSGNRIAPGGAQP